MQESKLCLCQSPAFRTSASKDAAVLQARQRISAAASGGKPDHRYGPLRFMRRVFDKQDVRDAIVWTEAIFSPLDIWSLIRLQNTEAKDDEMCTCPYEAQPLGPPFPFICRGESDAQNVCRNKPCNPDRQKDSTIPACMNWQIIFEEDPNGFRYPPASV